MGFLRKSEVFRSEEPYAFRYQADLAIPLTNMETEFRDVDVYDLRGQEYEAHLSDCGFEFRALKSSMSYEQFWEEDAIRDVYLVDLKRQLQADYGAVEVDFARVRVRLHSFLSLECGKCGLLFVGPDTEEAS